MGNTLDMQPDGAQRRVVAAARSGLGDTILKAYRLGQRGEGHLLRQLIFEALMQRHVDLEAMRAYADWCTFLYGGPGGEPKA